MIAADASPALVLDDEIAFANSIEPLLPIAFRLANGMLRNREDAEDAVQEAAMKAWRKRSTFRPGAEPRPWFLAIVANECKMHRRRPVLDPERAGQALEEPPLADPDTDDVERLRGALARIDYKNRLVLVLRFYLDLSNEDVGRTLGISAAAARVRVHRALQRLRPSIQVSEEQADG
ncbi:MAG: polymerase sigma-70 factor, subfamily [Chloroflexota bacterium]|nr:polymerase sigma-70 factor, subfamily [Chloroflexota bacterium]